MTTDRNAETVRTFLRLLEEKDIDTWTGLWAEDAEQVYPFGTTMFPPRLASRQVIGERWQGLPKMFQSLSFPIRELWTDGDTVIARFDGECVMQDGADYRNSYISVFHFTADGLISSYWEYFDPIVAGVAFGLAKVSYPQS
ncbi:nuclear transport factor 2 family protein [Kitasatospora sp. NPDC005856]|uniref:nuclear transport factor 2 family protein n=1 Tax=Kitasatospora sp. NPDC005856 TaxID=3154566 RepID=UPI0033C23C8D